MQISTRHWFIGLREVLPTLLAMMNTSLFSTFGSVGRQFAPLRGVSERSESRDGDHHTSEKNCATNSGSALGSNLHGLDGQTSHCPE
jgi:hypothetical protein